MRKRIINILIFGLFAGICIFGIILCVVNLVDNHAEYNWYSLNHVPDFVWCKILRQNIILLYTVLFILLVNLSFIIYNLIFYLKNKILLYTFQSLSKEDKQRMKNMLKKEKLQNKLKKIEEEI